MGVYMILVPGLSSYFTDGASGSQNNGFTILYH
jgi:hypothetical protein